MKKAIALIIFSIFILLNSNSVFAQSDPNNFRGAQAYQKHYKALYVLNSGDEKHIAGTLRNIKNAMNDPRLKDKLEVELIAFSDGVAVYFKTGKFKEQLEELRNRGVVLAQCENTIRERKIEKSELFDFISYVPSGNGEIIIRQQQGWAIVHP
ncbi:DsrE family protein [Pedobacter nototheniae]|uniref:DsrE family protein n=1 Tax=Pedobacter nototheniae TaxID=2488994 RepID=UPI00147875E6|nr:MULTISPECIES: DsrE family protein [Pedobacter]